MTRSKWPVLALMLLAFALRTYRLEAQSLWSDEGLSLYRARLSLGENLTNVIVVPPGVPTQDTNPPLYFVLLNGLRAVAGESEYTLRFLSVMAGVAIVPLLYATGKRLFSEQSAVLAAASGALSPFLVWYSQEARMYTLLVALGLASVYLLLRALPIPGSGALSNQRKPGRLAWSAWAVVTAAAVYTHFTSLFLLAFEGLVILAAVVRRRRREALLAVTLVVLTAIPIAAYAISRAAVDLSPVSGFRPLNSIAEELLGTFSIGWTIEFFQPAWAVLPVLGLLLTGTLAGLFEKPNRSLTGLLALACLVVVLVTFYAATFVRPMYTGPRHLALLAAPFYLLVGNGLAIAWRRWRGLGAAALVWIGVGMIAWLGVQFFDPAYVKQDIRSVAELIAERSAPGDMVVVHDAITSFVFDYYYAGAAPWIIIPTYPPRDVNAALAEFQSQAQAADRVWFVTHPPPLGGFDQEALDVWARGHLLRLDHRRFPALWLGSAYQLYTAHFPVLDALPSDATPMNVAWPTGLRLAGVADVSSEAAPPTAGGPSHLSLFWLQDKPAPENYVTTFRLVDRSGDERLRQSGVVFDNWSARQWPPGRIIRQDVTFDLPDDFPAGAYNVWLAVASRQSQQMLLTLTGEGDVAIVELNLSGE